MRASSAYSLFDTESVWAILMRIAPPVMLAQLIQAMYNIVDSYFVGQFSSDGLTALSIVYPVQLIVTAIAVGTGVGVNTLMSRYDGQGNHHLADRTAGTGTVLALISWLIFAVLSGLLMRPFAAISTESSSVADLAVTYGTIVCVGSPGVFLESTWSKVHQARGNMRLPMLAQIAGAAANIVLDPILIFGLGRRWEWPVPPLLRCQARCWRRSLLSPDSGSRPPSGCSAPMRPRSTGWDFPPSSCSFCSRSISWP